MKKITILFVAALFGQMLLAGPVSPGRALEIGRAILEGPATRGNPSEAYILWDGESSGSKPADYPAFYVIGRDSGGFVIVSGDDRARPVLGLSETNRFETENMPDNVRWWMESLKAYVRKQAVPGNQVRPQWARLLQTRAGDAHITGTVTDKVEHLTPEWDQGNNDQWLFKQQVCKDFSISVGAELNFNVYGRVHNSYEQDDVEVDVKYKGIEYRPFTIDPMAIFDYKDIGFYVKYSPMSVLKKDYGPDFKCISMGLYF